MAGDETGFVQIPPDFRQVFLFHTEQVDALAPGDFYSGNLVFLRCIGDGPQFLGIGDASPDARHD